MIRNFTLAFKDFLTKKFLGLSFLPFLLSLVVLFTIMIYGGSELYEALKIGAKSGDFSFLDESKFPIIATILSYKISSWIITGLFYTFGFFMVIIISLLIAMVVTGFLTPIITKHLNKTYNLTPKDSPNFIRVLAFMLKDIGLFLVILLITIPFLFVPVINLFVIHIPFFFIYYKFMLNDIASNIVSKNRFEMILKRGVSYKFIAQAFICYLISLVPILGLFLQIYFVLVLSHTLYQNEEKFRTLDYNQNF